MSRRRIEALKNLAERPGTEAEGIVAKEKLARLERSNNPFGAEGEPWNSFASFLRTGSMDDLRKATGPRYCDCGAEVPFGLHCVSEEHKRVWLELQRRFPRGCRVYYNRWAYPPNCPAVVVGFSRTWNWIRLKFDHLKDSISVPIYSRGKWHLSTDPYSVEDLYRLDLRGGMERIDKNNPSSDPLSGGTA